MGFQCHGPRFQADSCQAAAVPTELLTGLPGRSVPVGSGLSVAIMRSGAPSVCFTTTLSFAISAKVMAIEGIRAIRKVAWKKAFAHVWHCVRHAQSWTSCKAGCPLLSRTLSPIRSEKRGHAEQLPSAQLFSLWCRQSRGCRRGSLILHPNPSHKKGGSGNFKV